jgi:hypothetical protein
MLLVCFALTFSLHAVTQAQDATAKRGRKYKAPPATSHVEVKVVKKFNGKPIMNAAVIFDSTMDGKEEGNLEVKTDPDGKATIDVIPTGSKVRVQVIAQGFATFAEEYDISEPIKEISVAMLRPQEQISSYVDNEGKTTTRKPGVQEPLRPTTPAGKSAPMPPPAPPAAQQPSSPNTTQQQ